MTQPKIDNFEIVSKLGQGGMATVWKARQLSLDRFVAIKVLSSKLTAENADIARFRDEARAVAKLSHPGIVQVYDANYQNGCYYFVMELIDGITVGQWLRRKGRMPLDQALNVAESVATALDYSWRTYGIVHCDLKPENIMLDKDGSVKITDLGLSRSISAAKHGAHKKNSEILGTPAYMAPEQVHGETKLDCRTDIYGLGATLYHLLSGQMLFDGTPEHVLTQQICGHAPAIGELGIKVTLACEILLEKMLAKSKKHRQRDWNETLKDVLRVREALPINGVLPPVGGSSVNSCMSLPNTVLRIEAPLNHEKKDEAWKWFLLLAIIVAIIATIIGWSISKVF